jgi:hypothetical protein
VAATKRTRYEVFCDRMTTAERLSSEIRNGVVVYDTDQESFYKVVNNVWVKDSDGSTSKGWGRYDDTQWTSSNKLALLDGVSVVLNNNAGTVVRSSDDIDYYNGTTYKVLADAENELYMATVVFKFSSSNANQTFIRLQLEGGNGTPYERLGADIAFPKGNDVEHEFHMVFQYYADDEFVNNGSQWKITANGGGALVWDIIFFISKIQNNH